MCLHDNLILGYMHDILILGYIHIYYAICGYGYPCLGLIPGTYPIFFSSMI